MKKPKKDGRGGAREGAGRPAEVSADQRIALRLPGESLAKLDALQTRLNCANRSATVRELIEMKGAKNALDTKTSCDCEKCGVLGR
jgi:metal-responsive CopG/Arc/MetJ family transcriptional regulator